MNTNKTIQLVNGGQTIVDESDYEQLNQYRWFKSTHGYAYRQGWHGSQKEGGKHWVVWMHREINQTPEDKITDHRNRNKLDNRRSNLRDANKAQNSTNRDKNRKHNITSSYKGVSFHPSTNLWRARICDGSFEKTTYHLTDEQAALDYNRMAVERFGEYAHLNQLPDGIVPTEHRKKSSQYRGVSFRAKSKRWEASIDIDGKTSFISQHRTEREAAMAYNAKAIELRGDRAKLNQIQHYD